MPGPKIAPPEKHKLHLVYLIYLDGFVVGAVEATSPEEVVDNFRTYYDAGGRVFTAVEAASASLDDLEMLDRIFKLKTHLFNLSQISMAVRAQGSGIIVPPHGAGH